MANSIADYFLRKHGRKPQLGEIKEIVTACARFGHKFLPTSDTCDRCGKQRKDLEMILPVELKTAIDTTAEAGPPKPSLPFEFFTESLLSKPIFEMRIGNQTWKVFPSGITEGFPQMLTPEDYTAVQVHELLNEAYNFGLAQACVLTEYDITTDNYIPLTQRGYDNTRRWLDNFAHFLEQVNRLAFVESENPDGRDILQKLGAILKERKDAIFTTTKREGK